MRLATLFIICMLFYGFGVNHTTQIFVEFHRLKVSNVVCFSADNLGNIYTANSNGDIVKYDKEGTKTAVANNKLLGNVFSIDASNPFEIYVFYKEQNKVIYYDNQLNMLGQSNLEEGGFLMLSTLARSYDGKIWLFDQSDMKLKKVKKDLNLELSSGNVRDYANNPQFAPVYIGDMNNAIYLFDSTSGLYEFDNFGNFVRTIELTNASQFFVMSGKMYFLKNNAIYLLDKTFLQEKSIPIENKPEQIAAFTLSPDRMVLQSGNELILYALTNKNK